MRNFVLLIVVTNDHFEFDNSVTKRAHVICSQNLRVSPCNDEQLVRFCLFMSCKSVSIKSHGERFCVSPTKLVNDIREIWNNVLIVY